jgi:hypothetical protein
VDPSGTLLPGETDLAPGASDAVAASGGNVIAVLTRYGNSCDGGDVRAQVFDGDGVASSAQVVVGPNAQGFNTIAIGTDGSGHFFGVYGRAGSTAMEDTF